MSARLSVLIVEDHDALREVTVAFLAECGHEVRGAADAQEMDEVLSRWPAHIVVLDVNLPGEDGHSICKRLRGARPGLGILMLTARASAADRVAGYERGADVYLAKPTSNEELAAAIGSLGRRVRPQEVEPPYLLDEVARELSGSGGRVSLSEAEAILLRTLASAPGRQVEYWQLMDALGMSTEADAKAALEVRVVRLRKKLAHIGVPDGGLLSIRGQGYRLNVAVTIH